MQSFSLGAGLAAMAFWGFIAAVVVGGMWYDIRKREAQQETVRRLIESGQKLDEQVMDKLLSSENDKVDRLDRTFYITGMVLLPIAVGFAIFGKIMGMQFPDTYYPLMAVAALVGCIGIGFFIAATVAKRWYSEDDEP